jgi:TPR repeat protein
MSDVFLDGDAKAQFNLGLKYAYGNGVPRDDQEAVWWFRKAAEQGHAEAQFNLGVSYEGGDGVAQDYQEAVKWFRRAAEQGRADAQFYLGFSYDTGKGVLLDHEEAVRWYQLSAKQADATAQFCLGVSYNIGEGVAQDHEEAVKWFRLAAEQGSAAAQSHLGTNYANGQGVPQDAHAAAKWYRLAAEQGHANSQFHLGYHLSIGEGVAQDHKEAGKWYRLAAEQGHAVAQFNLGYSYSNGEGVAQDNEEAVRWYRLAAAQEHAGAQHNIDLLFATEKANQSVSFDAPAILDSAPEGIVDPPQSIEQAQSHGYVYSFYHETNNWLKVGFTSKPDEQACRARIVDYSKRHRLPVSGWRFIAFIATIKPHEIEQVLHESMRHFQVRHDTATELFSCSPDIFYSILLKHQEMLDQNSVSSDPRIVQIRNERAAHEKRETEATKHKQEFEAERSRRIRENTEARNHFEQQLTAWKQATAPLLESRKLLSKRELGRMGYAIGASILGGLYLLNQLAGKAAKTSVPDWVGFAAFVMAIMWLVRRSQAATLEDQISEFAKNAPAEPMFEKPHPELA